MRVPVALAHAELGHIDLLVNNAGFRVTGAAEESSIVQVVLAARDKTPRLRYPSGKAARQVASARRFLPRSLFDKILRSQFGLA